MDKAVTLSTSQPAARFGSVDLALILMAMIWGSNFVVLKFTFLEIAPMAFMALRFMLASALILIVLAARERTLALRREDYMKVIVVGVVGTSFYQPLFINGLALTTASNSSLILASTPAFIALINRVLGRERIDRRGWLGIALAFLGIVLIVESGGGVELGSATLLGDLIILAGTICWSLYSVLSAPLLKVYSPLRVTGLSMAFGTVPLLFVGAPALLAQDWSRVHATGWAGLGYSFTLAIVLAYIIWNVGVRRIGGARTAIYNNITPVVASLIAAVLLNEAITSLKILGAVVIFVGLYLARTGNLVMEPEA
jgi:drug/metabolite transporter (DMT)-like permease